MGLGSPVLAHAPAAALAGFLGPEEVELAGAALGDGDGAVLGEADGEEAEDLGDDAGAEDVDLTSEEAGPLAGDDDVDLDLADGAGPEDVDLTSEEAGPLAGDDDVDLDLADGAGPEDVDLTLSEEAGPLAGDDDVDIDLADGAGALAGTFAATPEIMATKMRVRTIT
ncbi:hypothetical protein Pyn_19382 [Prunus yedoensis var. nudiflora]|uniref:Uncharacterized protein n=1 Tax=Prunus yedoensis var. nudiflora TaxID=2094558 RepID=A0A314UEH0_PRUYE|nr:hypothetical protein Pyn_19382 [Prunus yedoensis var. nudiflora]